MKSSLFAAGFVTVASMAAAETPVLNVLTYDSFAAEWGPAVAKNPFLQFTVKGAKAGDKVAITWKDNRGDTRTDEATVS